MTCTTTCRVRTVRSGGGVPNIALPATARRGAVCRIVAILGAGSAAPCAARPWVVAGPVAVRLRGSSIRERTFAPIRIVHLTSRDALPEPARWVL